MSKEICKCFYCEREFPVKGMNLICPFCKSDNLTGSESPADLKASEPQPSFKEEAMEVWNEYKGKIQDSNGMIWIGVFDDDDNNLCSERFLSQLEALHKKHKEK